MDLKKVLGSDIKHYRQLKGYSQEEFSEMLIENAGTRFDKNTSKYLLNKDNYLLSFENLCEITIDKETEYLGKRIREKTIEDDYSLNITHRKETN